MRSQTDELITVNEIARLLKLNQQTIRNWIDAGTLPAVRVGRRVRVWRSDLTALIEAGAALKQTQPPAEPTPSFWDGFIAPPVLPGERHR